MKTQKKQLPNEFTFICDEHSKEQLEKLGVEFEGFEISDIGFYYFVENSKVQWNDSDQIADCPLIYLSDYIDQEQPELIGTTIASNTDTGDTFEIKTDGNRIPIEQKWQEKTRDGRIEIKEIKQIGNKLAVFGINPNIEIPENSEFYFICNSDGTNRGGNTYWDLLPYNPLLTTLEKELKEVRSKEKEILEKIEELKTK